MGAKCTIESPNEADRFQITLLKGEGTVNGITYTEGQNIPTIEAHNGQSFDVMANAHSKFRIMLESNCNNQPIVAKCAVHL